MERLKLRGILPWSFLLILLLLKIQTSQTTDNPAATATPTSSTTADLWRVKDGSIYDGDTLRVVRGSEELKIRFCGIDTWHSFKQTLAATTSKWVTADNDG